MRLSRRALTSYGGKKPQGKEALLRFVFAGLVILPLLTAGCGHSEGGRQARALTREANTFFNQGDYESALGRYAQLVANHPAVADRALFEMGVVYAYPRNAQQDYHKALACFEKLVRDYPDSNFWHDSQMMILQIHNVIIKNETIAAQQTQIENFQQEAQSKANEITILQSKIKTLEEKIFVLRAASIDKVLIEKKARRLTLLAKGEVVKTYPIALGGNPVGPKERQGDNKTPEGCYIIDARNGKSGFHRSLRISYPNAQDQKRARELGVSPGGDIMIHGLKNGFAPVGAAHAEIDWTEGCIAVTNQEMEEIYQFVPNGTPVEIKP